MNRLSLKNNRLKFTTAGKLLIILEEFIQYTPSLIKENRWMSICQHLVIIGLNQLCPKISPITGTVPVWNNFLEILVVIQNPVDPVETHETHESHETHEMQHISKMQDGTPDDTGFQIRTHVLHACLSSSYIICCYLVSLSCVLSICGRFFQTPLEWEDCDVNKAWSSASK